MGNVHRFDRAPIGMTERAEPARRGLALSVSIALSVFFIAVYGITNWLASRRFDVPMFFFGWERSIPFVSFFVLPYLSIDLFFVSAPFVCRSVQEAQNLSLRE